MVKTGKVEEYATGYAVRLMEQGKAVKATAEEVAAAEAAEAEAGKKKGKVK